MKKTFLFLNLFLSAVLAVLCAVYFINGGIYLKSACSLTFTTVGAVILVFAAVSKNKRITFPLLTFLGLLLCTMGDIVLFYNFIFGAVLFVCGHVLYVFAYCALEKPCVKDAVFIAVISAASVCVVTLVPAFNYGTAVMEGVAVVYALVISFMLGKAVSNLLRKPSAVTTAIALGSVLFFVSDIALAFNIFAGSPSWADPLCLATYFPGQLVIAVSLYLYNNSK